MLLCKKETPSGACTTAGCIITLLHGHMKVPVDLNASAPMLVILFTIRTDDDGDQG